MSDQVSPDVAVAILGCRLERAYGRYSEAGLFLVGLTPVEPADTYSLAIEHGINQIRQGYVSNAVGILRNEHQKVEQLGEENASLVQALLLLLYRYARLKMGDVPSDTLKVCDSIWARHLRDRQLPDFDYRSVELELYWHLIVSIFLRSTRRSELGCGNENTKDRLARLASHLQKEDRAEEAIEVLLVQRALWGSTSMQLPVDALSGIALGYALLLLGNTEDAALTFAATDHAHGNLDVKSHILRRNISQQKLDTTIVEAFGLIDGYQRIDYGAGVMRVLRLIISAYWKNNSRIPSEVEQLVGFWERRTGAAIMLLADPFILFEKHSSSFSTPAQEPVNHITTVLPPSINTSMQSMSLQAEWSPQHTSQVRQSLHTQQVSSHQTPFSPLPMPFSPLDFTSSPKETSVVSNQMPISGQQSLLHSPSQTSPASPRSPEVLQSSHERTQEPKPSPVSTETQPSQPIFDNSSVISSASEDSLYASPSATKSPEGFHDPLPHSQPHDESTNLESSESTITLNTEAAKPSSTPTSAPNLTQAERWQWFNDMYMSLTPLETPSVAKDKRKSQGLRSIFSGTPLKESSSTQSKNKTNSDQSAKGLRRLTLTSTLKRKKSEPIIEKNKENGELDVMGLIIKAEELRIKTMKEYQTGKSFEETAQKLAMVSIYKAVASWYLEGPLSLIYNSDEALNWLQCTEQATTEVLTQTVHEMRAIGTIMTKFGDGLGCFAIDASQQDVSDLQILRNESVFRAQDRMDAAVYASFVVLGTIEIILGNEQEARTWLEKAQDAAQHLDETHLINKSVMQTAANRAELALKLRGNRFLSNCEPLKSSETALLRSMLDTIEVKQNTGGSIPRDAELLAVGYYYLGFTRMEAAAQSDSAIEELRGARSYFENGVSLLKNFNMKQRRHVYISCLCGLYTTYIREGSIFGDSESLKKGFRYLHGLACAMEDLRIGKRITLSEYNDRQRLAEVEVWKRITKDAFHVLLLGMNNSLEQRHNENWNHFAMSLWVWVQLVKARDLADSQELETYFFESVRNPTSRQQQYLSAEKHLVQMVEDTPIIQSMELRQELRKLKKEMMRDHTLSTERTCFNGQARFSDIVAEPILQDVYFVDYFADGGGNILYLVVAVTTALSSLSQTKQEVRIGATGMTINDVGRWCGRYLNRRTMAHSLNGFNALDELMPLVSGLETMTEKGKLLVLCPTGQLSRIPLHAIRANGIQTLIERNPVIYTSTLHSSIYCVRTRNQPISWHEIARLPGVAMMPNNLRQPSSALTEKQPIDLEQSVHVNKIMQISGTVVLSEGNGSLAAIEVTGNPNQPGIRLTDSLLRTWILPANPLVYALLEQSGPEDMMRAIDPMALPTSLLLAGARSVVGSLWPALGRDNEVFTGIFNKQLGEFAQSGAYMVNLAYLMQKTVVGMMQDQERDAPYYWASFVLFGSWRLSFKSLE